MLAHGHTAWRKASRGGKCLETVGIPGRTNHPWPPSQLRRQLWVPLDRADRPLCPLSNRREGTAPFPFVGRNNKRSPCSLPPTAPIVPLLSHGTC